MTESARQLRALPLAAFNKETGEVDSEVDCAGCQEKNDRIEGLTERVSSLEGIRTRLKRDIAQMKGVAPGNDQVREVLEYAREKTGRKQAKVVPGSKAWKKVEERLAEKDVEGLPVFSVGSLKLAVDGAMRSEWHVRNKQLKPETIFGDYEKTQAHVDRAIDWEARLAPILKLPIALQQADLDYLAERCLCGCLRIEHPTVFGDRPNAGMNPCLRCSHCEDFDDIMVRAERWKAEQRGAA